MKKNVLFLWLVAAAIVLFAGCGASSPTSPAQIPTAIEGYIQKGPFILGSTVYVQELDDRLIPTGKTYFTTTSDDLGAFSLAGTIESPYGEITTSGFYFNEITGALSDAPLTLRTLSELSSTGTNINVNVLTTLARNRMEYLINTGGQIFADARTQAESELLEIFHITGETGILNFDKMNFSESGASNAILLAISATLQGTNTVGQLSEFISKVIKDIETDGTLGTTYTNTIKNNQKVLSLGKIRDNVKDRYTSLERTDLVATIPKFDDYVDSDGDGTINKDDTGADTFVWIWRTDSAEFGHDRLYHTAMTFDSKLWLMGGLDNFDIDLIEVTLGDPMNDVWYSSDGVTWTQATGTAGAGWSKRYGHTSVEFLGKMWVIEGRYSSGDVWSSSDGATWTRTTGDDYWSERYNHASVVFDNKMWIIGGADVTGKKNDVWYSSDGATWVTAEPIEGEVRWSARSGHTSVVFDDKMWVIGGVDGAGYSDEVWYSSNGVTWTLATSAPGWSARYGHASVVFDGKMWVIGGSTSGFTPNLSDIWYSSNGITWTQQTPEVTGWPAKNAPVGTVLNNGLWLIGGVENDNSDFSDVWEFLNYTNYSTELE